MDIIRDHLDSPRNPGRLADPSGIGSAGGNGCPDTITFYLHLRDNVITDITYESSGCPMAAACGSVTTELALGKDLDEASEIGPEVISHALGGLAPEHRHVAQMAAEALENAIWDHIVRAVEQAQRQRRDGNGVDSLPR